MGNCKYLILILLMQFTNYLNSQNDSIKSYIDEAFKNDMFFGVAAVIKNDSCLFYYNSGYSDFSSKDKLDTNSIFNIGSISKVFTGILILDLVEKKKISVDDYVYNILPNFKFKDIKVKHLLTHSSGIERVETSISKKMKFKKNIIITNKLLIEKLFRKRKFKKNIAPSKFIYSNQNYQILAMILEKVHNENYYNILDSFLKSNMILNTRFYSGFSNAKEISIPYLISDSIYSYKEHPLLDRFVLSDSTYGSGKIYSNIFDLYNFSKLIINKKGCISDSFYFKQVDSLDINRTYLFDYKIGKNGKKLYYHEGNSYGYDCILGIDKSANKVYIVLSNTENIRTIKGNRNYISIFNKLVKIF
ncbi:MAG: beta-lactamase family protein [Flavobacterium sp.]|nr:beta-lactamase family protein [Flavobacterium sp.]